MRRVWGGFLKRAAREGFWHSLFGWVGSLWEWAVGRPWVASACCSGATIVIARVLDVLEVVVAVLGGLFIGGLCLGLLIQIPPRVTGDGQRIARKIRRAPLQRAEQIYNRFMAQDNKQHTDDVVVAFWARLYDSDSERAAEFEGQHPGLPWRRILMRHLWPND